VADLASLVVDVDATGAAKGATELDKLSAAAHDAGTAVAAAGTAATAASTQMGRAATATGATAAAVRAATGAVTGLAAATTASAAATSAATATATAAATAAAAAATRATTGATGATAAAAAMGRTANLTAREIGYLGYQFQDVFVTAAMGMNPMMIALQQGTQMTQILGDRGVLGALKAIGSGLISFVLNPMTLMVVGIGLAATAAEVLWRSIMGSGMTAEEVLKKHNETIKGFNESYKQAEGGARQYFESISRYELEADTKRLKKQMAATTPNIPGGINPEAAAQLSSKFATPGADIIDARAIAKASDEIKTLNDAVKAGNPNYDAFRSHLVDIDKTLAEDSPVKSWIDDMIEAASTSADWQHHIEENEARLAVLNNTATDAQRTLLGLATVFEKLRDVTRGAFTSANQQLQSFAPEILTLREQAERAYQQRLEAGRALAGSPNAQRGAEIAAARDYEAALGRIGAQEEANRRGFALELQGLTARTTAERASLAAQQEMNQAQADGRVTADELLKVEQARQRVYAQDAAAVRQAAIERDRSSAEQMASAQQDVALIGKSVQEATTLRTQMQLINQEKNALYATTGSDVISQEDLDRIQKYAESMGKVATAATQARLTQDAMFDRSQIGVSGVDQQSNSSLRSAGIDPRSDFGQWYAEQARLNDSLRQTRDLGKDALKGFIGDLRSGTDGLTALGNMLNRIADKLIDMSIDDMFAPPGSKSGGVSGILQTLLGRNQPTAPPAAPVADVARLGLQASPWATGQIVGRDLPLPPGATQLVVPGGPAATTATAASSGILGLIRRSEGTAGANGYNTTVGYGKLLPGGQEQNLTGMTLDQIRDLQTGMLKNPLNAQMFGKPTSAVGAYQITQTTMGDLRRNMHLTGNEMFDQSMQDRMALELMKERGTSTNALQGTWAGLNKVDPATIQASLTKDSQQIQSGLNQVASTVQSSATSFVPQFSNGLDGLLKMFQNSGLSGEAFSAVASTGFAGLTAKGGYIPQGKWAWAGEAGAEKVYGPATVVPQQRSGPTQIEIVNPPGIPLRGRTEEVDDGRGGRRQRVVLEEGVASTAGRPRFNQAMAQNYGVRQPPVRR
jgi:muramidase (phage lysozyme)